MSALMWIAVVAFCVLTTLAIVIYMTPVEVMTKRKKKTPPPEPVKPVKDWEPIALRWEQKNQALDKEIAKMQAEYKELQKKFDEELKANKELQVNLAKEKNLLEKELDLVEKVKQKDVQLKDDLTRAQNALDAEMSHRFRLEREFKELKAGYDAIHDEKRKLSNKILELEAKLDVQIKDSNELRRTNKELSRQREDVQWVAKTEHDELKKKFKEMEHELDRVKRDTQTQPPGSGAS